MPEASAGPTGSVTDGVMRDVAVVGGGPVGLLLACLLAQRGLDVVVLERRTERSGRSRAIGIHPPGLRALGRVGLEAEVRRAGVEILDGRVTCQGRILGSMSFARAGSVWSLPQLETEAMLERRLGELAPDALERGVEVRAVRDRGTHVEVGADRGGAAVTVLARYVVGADGVRSGIRDLVGIDWTQMPGRAHYVMGDTRDDTGETSTALLHFEPAGVVESFPLPGGLRRWVAWVRRPPRDPGPAQLATIIASRVDGRFDVEAAAEPSVFEARQHLAERMHRGRVALVGDAAHEISPIGGQGMNLGWLDAVLLDRELEHAIESGAPYEAFDRYDRARRASASRAIRQAAFNMRMGAPAAGARLRVRNAAVRTLAVPPLRALLARAFTMRWL
ncbi:FAD-dependent oxidoreductase [Agromyces sp. NPDC056965]|uniref:FAD-dependent oxidoreductase n=1 Tax=Agromyces sp. NPDC056965 TaxID=3345983 RepID=UPI00363B7EFA